MKRFFAVLMMLVMLFSTASAKVYMGKPPAEGWTEDVLRVTAIPVGEGDAILLECGGEVMMVDGGPSALYHQLTGSLDARGIKHFKYLLNTHYHDDHINGLYHLMKNDYTADEYMHPYSNVMVQGDKFEKRTVEMAEKKGITVAQAAMAWIYNQKFDVFALSSPVTQGQIDQNIAAIEIELTDEEVAWLNLQ